MTIKYSAEQQRIALHYIRREWESAVSKAKLHDEMKIPNFSLHSGKAWGSWDDAERCIYINQDLPCKYSWSEVIKTIRHEMAHQWVSEVAAIHDQTDHGPAFKMGCKVFDIDCKASASFKMIEESDKEEIKISEKISKLLSLAQSQNEHESDLAMQRANELITKYNIDSVGKGAEFDYTWLGTPVKRKQVWDHALFGLITDHFFVQGIWVYAYTPQGEGWIPEINGLRKNIEMAEYVFEFLKNESQRRWFKYKRETGCTNRERRSFLYGLFDGFGQKLKEQQKSNDVKFKDEAGYQLVKVGDKRLNDYFDSRHPRTRMTGGGSSLKHIGALDAGRSQGKSITIHRGVSRGGTGSAKYLT